MLEADTQNSDERLYLDDLFVGQRFTSRTHVIDEAQIKAFARQFDPQPFHQDENSAKASLFAGLVANGWARRSSYWHNADISKHLTRVELDRMCDPGNFSDSPARWWTSCWRAKTGAAGGDRLARS